MKKKSIMLIGALMLIIGAVVGGTIAWLTTNTTSLKNTFTAGDISIELDEGDELDLKMVPGKELTKDPVVTVKANSEASWLFVKVEKSSNFDTFLTYAIADGWTALSGVDGVYYREVAATPADMTFHVIANDKVTVINTVTKNQLNALSAETYPTLTFTAYACQREKIETAAAAWGVLNH